MRIEGPMLVFGFRGTLVLAGMSTGPVPSVRTPDAARPSARAAMSTSGDERKEAVYRRLFDQHWSRVRRHLECYIENEAEVDELTAEVFLVAWRKLDPRSPMPLSWLLRTAHNKLRDRARSARSRERAVDALVRGLENPAQPLDPMEVLALRTAITSLNARERQVVVLTYWDDLSAGEIADVLRTSQGAVWTTLSRARNKLRVQLEEGER